MWFRFISCSQSLCLQCHLHFQVYLVLVKYTGRSVCVQWQNGNIQMSWWKISSHGLLLCCWQTVISSHESVFNAPTYSAMWSLLPHTWTRVRLSELYVPGSVRVGWCALRENEQVLRIQCVWESDTEKTTRRLLSSDIVERESDQGSRDTAL